MVPLLLRRDFSDDLDFDIGRIGEALAGGSLR
jgi:hypothetical protein